MTVRLLRQAIASRLVIEFAARGHRRHGEPHLLGVSRNGKVQIEFFQTGGGSRSGAPAWKRLNVSQISELQLREETFSPRPTFDPSSDYWAIVRLHVR